MKKFLLTAVFMVFVTPANAELYKLYVKRLDTNIYKDTNTGMIIETQFCFKWATGEEAVLKYEKYSYDNKIIFDDGTTCAVKNLR
ncbi:MAG: hypothetical protein LBQ18_06470 [Campylobacteraceae bacterium]|jgi:hypothetical protein|nr:hypothetical protein [Campylobacteraceae bacterium]